MAELPLDILLFNIFPRLPVKSLVRFMCVCKQWASVLTTPEFARMHLNSITKDDSQDRYRLLLLSSSTSHHGKFVPNFRTLNCEAQDGSLTTSRFLPFEADPKGVSILASSDGLLCVGIDKDFSNDYKDLLLWNPTTGSYKKLSNSNSYGYYDENDAYGFCYDLSNDDYKLLHIISKGDYAYIYSLRSDSWRKIESEGSLQHIFGYRWSLSTFANETLYFMAEDCYIRFSYAIISFDLKKENFRELPSPPVRIEGDISRSIKVLRGCVHICYFYEDWSRGKPEIDLWRLDGTERRVWVKAATISIPYNAYSVEPLYMMRNGNLLVFDVLAGLVFKLDPENHTKHDLLFSSSRATVQERIYIESLVSPNL